MNISSASIFSDDFHNWLKSLMREIISESLQEFRGQNGNPYPSRSETTSKVMSRKDAAAFMGVTPNTISRWHSKGYILSARINGKYRFFESDLLKFLEKRKS